MEEEEDEQKTIMTVNKDGDDGYEKVTIIVDSGAADTVGPKKVGDELPIKPTRASKLGINYKAANGTSIRNCGERRLRDGMKKGSRQELRCKLQMSTRSLAQ